MSFPNSLRFFFRLIDMATPPPEHFGLSVDMEMFVADIIDVEEDVAYRRCITTIWVEKRLDILVPHLYIALYIWFDGISLAPFMGLTSHSDRTIG